MELLLPILVALLLVFVAWKVLVGIVKTAALVGIVLLAGAYVFANGGMA
ncbi:hypothetical protein [Altererythrobacter lauratis]|uniref:DUF3096 domain-containing protein n=1 Tax=Alteraurantiacibacter lauratis TaxID=2054627 RepID=A0ABV7EDS3_9SPHN